MRLLGIVFLLCVSIGTVSSFSLPDIKWPPWVISIFGNALDKFKTKVCSRLVANPDLATNVIQKINETLQRTEETRNTFAGTIIYINSPENPMKLTSESTCPTFINEMYDALVTDLKNKKNNVDLQDAKQKALDLLKNSLDKLI